MKQSILIVTAVALVFVIQLVTAGSVTDTYTSGDTLTTTILNNIKTAVNDNNTASRFYGDGSAGSLTVSGGSSIDWTATPPAGNNLNFTSVVIAAGGTLTVPAGTTIRCSGTFINNGILVVSPANNTGRYTISSGVAVAVPSISPPGRGDAFLAAGLPAGHTALGVFLNGGQGGKGIPQTLAASSFNNFKFGGGAGAALVGASGQPGGGLVKIYCQGNVVNNGTITAEALVTTGGGGGGGIVILASSTSVNNDTGTISAQGGAGQSASGFGRGASGGGGGGIIIMVAPAITNLGTTSVTGGAAGASGVVLINAVHTAGAGGGASGGNGGGGGSITFTNLAAAAFAGDNGYVLEITANPAHMM